MNLQAEPELAPPGSCILAERAQNGPIQGAQHWGASRHPIVGGLAGRNIKGTSWIYLSRLQMDRVFR